MNARKAWRFTAVLAVAAAAAGSLPASASAVSPHESASPPTVRNAPPRLVPAFEGFLDGVAATSASNAWAVGDDASNTLIVHWNGSAWKKVPAPNPDPRNDTLAAVSAASASDIWAVGTGGR
jgi:hypothetical protein